MELFGVQVEPNFGITLIAMGIIIILLIAIIIGKSFKKPVKKVRAKITLAQRKTVKSLHKKGFSNKEISVKLKIKYSTISAILNK